MYVAGAKSLAHQPPHRVRGVTSHPEFRRRVLGPLLAKEQQETSRMTFKATNVNLLVVASPETPELSVLQKLPAGCKVIATGQTLADLSHLSDEQWISIDVVLNCGVGKNAGKRENVQVCYASWQQRVCVCRSASVNVWLPLCLP